jgi:hypothetical protein
MMAAGTGRRLGNSITEASGFVRGSSLEPYRIVGTSRIISDDGKVERAPMASEEAIALTLISVMAFIALGDLGSHLAIQLWFSRR